MPDELHIFAHNSRDDLIASRSTYVQQAHAYRSFRLGQRINLSESSREQYIGSTTVPSALLVSNISLAHATQFAQKSVTIDDSGLATPIYNMSPDNRRRRILKHLAHEEKDFSKDSIIHDDFIDSSTLSFPATPGVAMVRIPCTVGARRAVSALSRDNVALTTDIMRRRRPTNLSLDLPSSFVPDSQPGRKSRYETHLSASFGPGEEIKSHTKAEHGIRPFDTSYQHARESWSANPFPKRMCLTESPKSTTTPQSNLRGVRSRLTQYSTESVSESDYNSRQDSTCPNARDCSQAAPAVKAPGSLTTSSSPLPAATAFHSYKHRMELENGETLAVSSSQLTPAPKTDLDFSSLLPSNEYSLDKAASTGMIDVNQSRFQATITIPDEIVRSKYPPPSSTNNYTSHLTPSLRALAAALPLSRCWSADLPIRKIEPLERGHWLIPLHVDHIWASRSPKPLQKPAPSQRSSDHSPLQIKAHNSINMIKSIGMPSRLPEQLDPDPFKSKSRSLLLQEEPTDYRTQLWDFLRRFVGTGRAGFGVWCIRAHARQITDLDANIGGPDTDCIKVYCWGEVVPEIFAALYIGSHKCVLRRGAGVCWIDAAGDVVVQL